MIPLTITTWVHLDRSVTRTVLLMILFLVVLLSLSACGFPAWRDQVLRDVAEGRWKAIDSNVGPSAQPSQTVEFYDRSGRHIGYGVTQGGTTEFYRPDGSRAGYGRIGR